MRNHFLIVVGCDIVLEGVVAFAVGVLEWGFVELLLFQGLIVDTSEIIVLKLDVLEFRTEYIHFTAILEDDFIIQIKQSLLCLVHLRIFNKSLPYLGLFEDEDFDDGSVGGEQLIEVIVSNNIAILVVDADEENWAGAHRIIPSPNHQNIYNKPHPHTPQIK